MLHIDIETYSSVDIRQAGAYAYAQSIDFDLLLFAFAFDDEPVAVVDLLAGQKIPQRVVRALKNPNQPKAAHNAAFERWCLAQIGYPTEPHEWTCTAVKSAYCGLPLSLGDVSKALELKEHGKATTGRALIKYFCVPCRPTKVNGGRRRNLPEHDPEKWAEFVEYCRQDVIAEREITRRLRGYELPLQEKAMYALDQRINDRGVLLDLDMAAAAVRLDNRYAEVLQTRVRDITGVENPKSVAQLKTWLKEQTGKVVASLNKKVIGALIDEAKEAGQASVVEVLELRKMLGKSSTKKYNAMLVCAGPDKRARGLFQFYGATRTGRWAGRLIQLQNLPQNHLDDLDGARSVIRSGVYDNALTVFGEELPSVLSQLIRTALIAEPGHTFCVADFSAIEARVIAWLANEVWRMDVFNSHGKIYEASASAMFGVPLAEITKGSDYRAKGKVAELALGYQGGVGALKTMGGEKMGLTEEEMAQIVKKWRKASPAIVQFWKDCEANAKRALRRSKPVYSKCGRLVFTYDGTALQIQLPSGRKLFYYKPKIGQGKFGPVLKYMGLDRNTRRWSYQETYGGKLVENIVQATARDLLAYSMLQLDAADYYTVMHVHDEVVVRTPARGADEDLERICDIMGNGPKWSKGLPLKADGYVTRYYKKD